MGSRERGHGADAGTIPHDYAGEVGSLARLSTAGCSVCAVAVLNGLPCVVQRTQDGLLLADNGG